jgi:hypothetical protein
MRIPLSAFMLSPLEKAEAAKYLRQWASATDRSVEAAEVLGQQLIRHIDLVPRKN